MDSFWLNVKNELDYRGISQKELAESISESYDTLRTWIKNDRYPNAKQAVTIAKVLHTSVEYLVTGKDEKIKPENTKVIELLEQAISKLR